MWVWRTLLLTLNNTPGTVYLIDGGGSVEFGTKAILAQEAGAAAVIIIQNVDNEAGSFAVEANGLGERSRALFQVFFNFEF